jgi:hypothetical protein
MINENPAQEDECENKIEIADDFGDNSATIRCRLDRNHKECYHQETFDLEDEKGESVCVQVIWQTYEQRKYFPYTLEKLEEE